MQPGEVDLPLGLLNVLGVAKKRFGWFRVRPVTLKKRTEARPNIDR